MDLSGGMKQDLLKVLGGHKNLGAVVWLPTTNTIICEIEDHRLVDDMVECYGLTSVFKNPRNNRQVYLFFISKETAAWAYECIRMDG